MNWIRALLLALLVVVNSSSYVSAQVAGSTSLGVTAEELRGVMLGWSAKKQVLGKTVYNESNEKVGAIDDLIIAPDRAVSFAIIGAGGFAGTGRSCSPAPPRKRSRQCRGSNTPRPNKLRTQVGCSRPWRSRYSAMSTLPVASDVCTRR